MLRILPSDKKGWLRLIVFPFKAYVIIAPVFAIIFSTLLPSSGRYDDTHSLVMLILGLLPCSGVLCLAALLLYVAGPKGVAPPCLGFALAALILFRILLPAMVN